ncbi:MAG: anaerobic ribonucleoside-triphosphate reductase activating protein [Bacteroides sp.]|nr:anaerobic ribonucleoside-triphosphate reductase activating protein [Bacteroides sp.]
MEISILDIVEDTTVDGPGFRTSIYAAGCGHRCPGCHNPESWDIRRGKLMSVDSLLEKILSDEFANVTFSGGDPLYQAEGFTQLAREIKLKSRKTIWCYTGLRFETILLNKKQAALLRYIDVLVDGRYEQSLRNESLLFRGSKNQRLIDVQSSLREGRVVSLEYNPFVVAV